MIEIHPAFESKIRILIIGALINGSKNFTELKELAQATDGNLITHLCRLQKSDFVTCKKTKYKNKPQSLYTLTKLGKDEFISFVAALNMLLSGQEMPPEPEPEEEDFQPTAENITLSDDEIWL